MSRDVHALRLAAAGLSLIAVCYGLARFAYGLFLPVLTEEFGLDAAAAVFGAVYIALTGLQLLWGVASTATIAFGVAAAVRPRAVP